MLSSAVTTKSVTFTASATDNYSMSSSPTYVFYIDGSSTAAQSGTSKTYTLNNLTAGTKHTAIVKVKDQEETRAQVVAQALQVACLQVQ